MKPIPNKVVLADDEIYAFRNIERTVISVRGLFREGIVESLDRAVYIDLAVHYLHTLARQADNALYILYRLFAVWEIEKNEFDETLIMQYATGNKATSSGGVSVHG